MHNVYTNGHRALSLDIPDIFTMPANMDSITSDNVAVILNSGVSIALANNTLHFKNGITPVAKGTEIGGIASSLSVKRIKKSNGHSAIPMANVLPWS